MVFIGFEIASGYVCEKKYGINMRLGLYDSVFIMHYF